MTADFFTVRLSKSLMRYNYIFILKLLIGE